MFQRIQFLMSVGGLLALLGLFAACSSTPDGPEPLTPESELPPDYASAWRAWYEDTPESEEWEEWRPKVAADPRLAEFFTDNLIRVMVRHYDFAAMSRPGELPGLFERSQRELLRLGESSAPKLVELVFLGDPIVSRLAGDLLLEMDDRRWTLPVARKLEEPGSEERRRAADWLARLPHAGKDEERVWELLGKAALEDEEWAVRAQAVIAVGERSLATGSLDRARPILSRALSDEEDVVVKSACRGFSTNGDLRAVPALINLLDRLERADGDPMLIQEGQRSLEDLSGLQGHRTSDEWRDWWRENRP